MPTSTDKPSPGRPPYRFFTTLRDVLFETTPEGQPKVSLPARASEAPDGADLEAARSALRQSLGEQLGPAVREFALQVEALREALPDAAQRQRAALRVLALKGISAQALVLELERALAALAAQNEAFAEKLSSRRAALEEQRASAVETCRRQSADAEQAILSLQAALDAERAKITEAGLRREQLLGECEQHATLLAQKQLGFERAYAEVSGEYTALKRQLSSSESL